MQEPCCERECIIAAHFEPFQFVPPDRADATRGSTNSCQCRLSRRKQGFDSPMGRHHYFRVSLQPPCLFPRGSRAAPPTHPAL